MKVFKTLLVKTPQRGTPCSAGLDFFVPENSFDFWENFKIKNSRLCISEDLGFFRLNAHERVNIPSGIKCEIPEGYALIAYNKSGISLKYGLDVGATVVDEDYHGEIHISLTNTTESPVTIYCGQKIVQFLLLPIKYESIELVDSEQDCFTRVSERGEGGFGSTGEK